MNNWRNQLERYLRWGAALGIATIALLRCVVVFAPQVVFDVDPALSPEPFNGLGPAGSLILDVLLLTCSAAGLLGESLAGRGLNRSLLFAALLPAPVILWHGAFDAGDMWLGATWLAAAIAAATVSHLARDRSIRIMLVALLVAIAGPLLGRGLLQIGPEHAATVAEYEKNKSMFLMQRGWEDGSSQALTFERRLYDAEPIGWFITSNVYASVMAGCAVVLTGLFAGAIRFRRWTPAAIVGIAAVAAWIGLLLSGSKGGIGAAAIGAGLVIAFAFLIKCEDAKRRWAAIVGPALLVATLFAVAMRGMALPEDFAGDRSLLFRWHYLIGAGRVIADSPKVGVGPDGFKQAYTAVREPRSPEEVSSAHSMFADWLATLGVSGIAWVALMFMLIVQPRDATKREVDSSILSPRHAALIMLVVAALALGIAVRIELLTIADAALKWRGLGVLAFLAIAFATWHVLRRLDSSIERWAIFAAGCALLVHGQIEMTFTQPGSAAWVFVMIGLAGHCRTHAASRLRAADFVAAALALIVCWWVLLLGAVPAIGQQRLMVKAAASLSPPADDPLMQVQQRIEAADLLNRAYDAGGRRDPQPLEAAARQMLLASFQGDKAGRALALQRASESIERAVEAHDKASSIVLAEAISAEQAHMGHARKWSDAIEFAMRLAEIDPHGIVPWTRLGDRLWEAGRREEAVAAYRRALENDANFELDPLRQMTEKERERVRSRVRDLNREP